MMRFERMITTIDTHTAGEPTRTVLSGIPPIPGKTMSEKMLFLQQHMDALRTVLVFEPRGNEVMSGAIMTEPCDPAADIGVIYIEVGGYLPMCGHDTIGFCTALLEAGILPKTEPITEIKLDTPAGLVVAHVRVEKSEVQEVSFTNIPSFLYRGGVEVKVPEIGTIKADIAYGGNFYAIVEAEAVGLRLKPEHAAEIVKKGVEIRKAVNAAIEVRHPDKPFISGLTHVEFYAPPEHPSAMVKNAVVIPPGSIDRSPCGTGTSAKLATLFSKGEIKIGEEFVHESIIGTLFRGKIVHSETRNNYSFITPEITGSAYITGFHNFVIDPKDPLKEGYLLGLK
jgi:proline racemase